MKNILVTGTSGYVGHQIISRLAQKTNNDIGKIVALDVRVPENKILGVTYYKEDICNLEGLKKIFEENEINTVIHLAAVLAPSKNIPVELMYEINVTGTNNLLECASTNNVERFICASSGAAYGYHSDNSAWLSEDRDEVRGNFEFPYSYHKRLNEVELAKYRKTMPSMKQFVFRIGTVLGIEVNNLITDLFKKPFILGVKGSKTPFVFIWDEDLVEILMQSIWSENPGVYNIAGDGAVDLPVIAKFLNKKFIPIPSKVIETALFTLKKLSLSQYGPEQVKFLKYRPVLDNAKLKSEFKYQPKKSSQETFEYYLENRKFN